jgi:hypothetical protein
MKKEFLKMAGVENEKDFYKLFPTEAAFFGMYPEAKKLVQKRHGGQALPKAQFGKGKGSSSMTCTREGCAINDPALLAGPPIKIGKPKPPKETTPWEILMASVNPVVLDEFKRDPYTLASEGMKERYKRLSNPLNQYVDEQGNWRQGAPKGEPENFYKLMTGLKKGKAFDPEDPLNEDLQEWIRQSEMNEEGKKINKFKDLINKNYFTGFEVPSKVVSYFSKGGALRNLPKAQDGVATPEDQERYDKALAQKIKWYEGRSKHENPQIQKEAEAVLSELKKYPTTLSNVKYVPAFELYSRGTLGEYDQYDKKIIITQKDKLFPDSSEIPRPARKVIGRHIKRIKNDPEELKNLSLFAEESQADFPRTHEIGHYLDTPALEQIKKHNKKIYDLYTPFKGYLKSYLKDYKPESKFGVINDYYWVTGTRFTKDPVIGEIPRKNKIINAEMKNILDDLRNLYNIDPSKDTTPEQWKEIFNKVNTKFFDPEKSFEDKTRYEHFKELFRALGDDPSKINILNNLIVQKNPSTTPIARNGGVQMLQDKNFEKSNKFNNLLMSGVRKSNLFKAQDGLEYVQQLEADEAQEAGGKPMTKEEYDAMLSNPYLLGASLIDPSGVSNWPYMFKAWGDLTKSKGVKNTAGNLIHALLETAGSIPMFGKAVAPIKGIKALSKFPKTEKVAVKAKNALTKIQPIAGIDKKLYSKLYNTNPNKLLAFTSPIGRMTRFGKGVELGMQPLLNDSQSIQSASLSSKPTVEESSLIKIKLPNGSYKYLTENSEEYAKLYDYLDPNSFNMVDTSFSLKKDSNLDLSKIFK